MLLAAILLAALVGGTLLTAMIWRVVVQPNEVHIVQSSSGTKVYGRASTDLSSQDGSDELKFNGNSYYAWPSWLPFIGLQSIKMPLSVFDLKLNEYEAYDIGRVPFVVDVVAFFRIENPAVSAKRVSTLEELNEQLMSILQGAVRTILAKHDIEEIMGERSTFGQMFTDETEEQLTAWGVSNVKNIELMDVRDGHESRTISNIMAKKESFIEMESRKEVAENTKEAELAEIDATRAADVRKQEALQKVGERTAEKDKKVGVATQQAEQEIKVQEKITAEKEMGVQQVEQVRQAEITKDVNVVKAEEAKQVDITTSEGEREKTRLIAEGILSQEKLKAEGILAVGTSEAESKRLLEMSTVDPQIVLATEIGENEGYQSYLINIRGVEKDEVVGVQQAKALQDAGIKVIANTGNVSNGVNDVMDLFSSKGGTAIGSSLEAFANTEQGAAIMKKFGINGVGDVDMPTPSASASDTSDSDNQAAIDSLAKLARSKNNGNGASPTK